MEREVFTISTSFYKRVDWVDHIYEGLKAQTYPFWEWVVTDDFSEELNAEEKLRDLARRDPRVRYYTQKRKKELFYNPQYGSCGNIVMQLDSDDTIYANLLEQYVKYFREDRELMGITCGHIMKKELKEFVSISAYGLEDRCNIDFAPMARAWKNTIPHFDEGGELHGYQNDTNIWRQVEARGKVMFIPRELYNYNYSGDSISKIKYSPEQNRALEGERLRIEKRFPSLNDGNTCTFDLKYLPIDRLSWSLYGADFNRSIERKNVLFLKTDIKPYEKQLLNELFYDHSLHYDVDSRESYDEIVAYLNVDTYEYLCKHMPLVKEKFKGHTFRFFIDDREFELTDSKLEIFGTWSFWKSGGLYYGHLSL